MGLADFPVGQDYGPPQRVLVRNQTLISMITTDPKSTPYFYTNTEAIDIASELH